MLKAGGTVEEYEAKADSVEISLRQELQCFLPACVLTVTATVIAGSVILTVVATDTSEGGDQVAWAVLTLQSKTLDAMSSVLGVNIEEPPAVPSVVDVEVVVTRFAPSPPPPLPPRLSGALWALLPLSVLLIACVVLFVLCYRRVSRDRANLRISRDRANLDLQMISHQVQRVKTHADDSASQPDSLPAKRPISLAKAPTASLPPGPPSSSTGPESVAEREVTRPGAAGSGVAPTVPSLLPAPTVWTFPSLRHAGYSAAPKRPAPESASASLANKRAFTNPYLEFCQEQRPLLMPLGMANRDREKLLGEIAP